MAQPDQGAQEAQVVQGDQAGQEAPADQGAQVVQGDQAGQVDPVEQVDLADQVAQAVAAAVAQVECS